MTSVPRICSIESCARIHEARGWCVNHYRRWKTYGDPLGEATRLTPEQVHNNHLAASRNWKTANAERSKAKARDYKKNHPEVVAQSIRKRRATRLGGLTEPYTVDLIINLYGTDCHICHEPIDMDAPRWAATPGFERGLHLDHVIPLNAGGSDLIENIRPSHGLCNLKKSRKAT